MKNTRRITDMYFLLERKFSKSFSETVPDGGGSFLNLMELLTFSGFAFGRVSELKASYYY